MMLTWSEMPLAQRSSGETGLTGAGAASVVPEMAAIANAPQSVRGEMVMGRMWISSCDLG